MAGEKGLNSGRIRQEYLDSVVNRIDTLLTFQRPEGCFIGPNVEWLGLTAQGVIYPLAFLFTQDLPHNRYFQDQRLLDAAVRLGDWLTDNSDEIGRLYWPIPTFDDFTFDRRTIAAWFEAYLLLADHLDAPRRDRWEARLRGCWGYLGPTCQLIVDAEHFSGPHLGTGTNHRALEVALATRMAAALDEPTWQQQAHAAVAKFLADQHPDGYWDEHHGPALKYNTLSMAAAGLIYEYTADAAALEAIKRSLDLYLHWTYPDGSLVGTIDERNRYHRRASYWGHFALSLLPEGRRLAALLQEQLRSFWTGPCDEGHMEAAHRYIENYRYWHDGPVARTVPPLRSDYAAQLTEPACIVKRGPWVLSVCGICSPKYANRFYMDRQGILGVWHEAFGEVLDQSSARDQPELATFAVQIGSQTFVVPQEAQISVQDSGCAARLRFGPAWLELAVRILDQRTVQVRASRGDDPADSVTFVIRPVLKVGEAIRFGPPDRSEGFAVGRVESRLSAAMLAGNLQTPRCGLRFDSPAEMVWPIRPYNPYNIEMRYGFDMAVCGLSFDLSRAGSVNLTVEAG